MLSNLETLFQLGRIAFESLLNQLPIFIAALGAIMVGTLYPVKNNRKDIGIIVIKIYYNENY